MEALLEVKNLKKYFATPRGTLHAVDNVSFTIKKGQTLGVVGESGCGKSTLGRTILHLLEPTDGAILFEGRDITKVNKKKFHVLRQEMQMIFQDPFSSINPRMTVSGIIEEPVKIYKMKSNEKERREYVQHLMRTVGLSEDMENKYPHEMDGGRRQRIGIARALALDPKFIVCDEPVSALDVSIQAQILNLMMDLQEQMNLTFMFITHDLSVVKHISDEICVMYLGMLVEKSPSKELFKEQYHPYTKALLSAIPRPKLVQEERVILKGEISSPINVKEGCRFAPRCLYCKDKCRAETPTLEEISPGHQVACHYVKEINGLT
ncbi:MAG: ATP-binding cassette domain-containing protein [Intestinimonas sp.]|jgi:peptide/nickel transport system ATP-binding protein|nr:ATP-binding cassette domain-containing protein [Intestinimonas sp.]